MRMRDGNLLHQLWHEVKNRCCFSQSPTDKREYELTQSIIMIFVHQHKMVDAYDVSTGMKLNLMKWIKAHYVDCILNGHFSPCSSICLSSFSSNAFRTLPIRRAYGKRNEMEEIQINNNFWLWRKRKKTPTLVRFVCCRADQRSESYQWSSMVICKCSEPPWLKWNKTGRRNTQVINES